jgi:acetyl-CoA C-acetyltransferase
VNIAVIGASCTPYGEWWDKSLRDLLAQAQLTALEDAGLMPKDIQEIFVANMCAGQLSGQVNLGAMAADILGIHVPSTRIEGACASGALAVRAGIAALESGRAEVVMVSGVEKMTDVDHTRVTESLMSATDYETEGFVGATFPALFALVTRAYMHTYNLTREQLAQVSVKNHKHGALNPSAHFRKEISVHDVLKSSIVADPLTLLDCSPMSDGAASIILSTPDFAKKINKHDVKIIASTQACDTLALSHRKNITQFYATQQAGQQAYKQAGITPRDINLVEVHDAFSTSEIIALEDLGFFDRGTAGHEIAQGTTNLNNRLTVNASGGLKAKGHPIGASGIGQIVELMQQLRNQCGARQVHNAKIGLAHSMGGLGATVAVHILTNKE